jgi:hypothetical protein
MHCSHHLRHSEPRDVELAGSEDSNDDTEDMDAKDFRVALRGMKMVFIWGWT